ncbi:MAG: CAP domain-containing protein [Bacteroidales bacterium]|nr:MAG: CAP domain-containing protein [Bacteroidales bacterium]
MKLIIIYIKIFVLLSGYSFAQKSDIRDYYSKINLKNFRKEKLFNEQINFDSIDFSRLHAAIFFVTNEERAKKRLSFLEYAPELERAALMHSRDMYEKKFFSHYNPSDRLKKTPNDRAALAGILNPYLAENIATSHGLQYKSGEKVFVRGPGQFSYKIDGQLIPPHTYLSMAETIVASWMGSKGHRRNILSDEALQLGCGTYFYQDKAFNNMPTFMATQNFQLYKKIRSN